MMIYSRLHPLPEIALAVSLFHSWEKNWFIEYLSIYPRSEIWGNGRELYNILLYAEIVHF